ANLLGVK
ncbi:hypothetical protein MK338_00605, partial [Streptococcus vestibularis]|nr:hypothetical protein [Streptococcus vestibularis]